MDKIGNLLKEPKMCCIGLHTTSGVVGVLLLLVGGCQIGIGIYFQLTPPGFHIASNIWTGLATGVAGTSLMYYGHANRPLRNNYLFLSLCLISLLTNILNVVIVQVGENSKFLTEEDKEFIYQDNQKKFFDIAIFSSTIISSVVIIFTFAVAQCLFCGHLKRPKLQNQIAFVENLNQEKLPDASGNRFFPPSRTAAKVVLPLSRSNGLWIPRTVSSGTWHEGVGGEGFGVGSLDNLSEVNESVMIDNVTLERLKGNKAESGVRNSCIDISDEAFNSEQKYLVRCSTFKPKKKSLKNSIENGIYTLQEVSGNSTSRQHTNSESEDIPAYLQNHPDSWMFLLPEDNNDKAQLIDDSELTSQTFEINSKDEENLLDPSKLNCTKTLLKASPRSRPKVMRPLESPPLPPVPETPKI